MMSPASFTTTAIVSESTLNRKSYRRQLGAAGKILQLTLLGANLRGGADGYPELVYAATRGRDDAKIRNVIQMGASILSSSRVLFLGLLREMLRLLDPCKAQLCYVGECAGALVVAAAA